MKIAFNPSNSSKNILDLIKNNKDIIFDLKGHSIYARGVEFKGTDTNTWRPVVDNLTSNSATSSLSANQGRVLAGLINGKSDSDHNHDGRYLKLTGGTLTGNLVGTSAMFSGRFYGNGDDEGIIIKPSSNGYAGLILGTHDGERSIFYFVKNKPFWRYSHGSDNLDIIHPKKSGTIALTSDIPSSVKNPYSLTTFGVVYDGSAKKVVSPSNFISQLKEGTSVVTDGTMFVTSYATDKGFADTNAVNIPYKRKAVHLWEYIKAKTDSLYATKNHNHDGRYVRTFGTSNDNIDSDWGESFKTFDPIPSGTPPEQSANISLLSIGNNFNHRKQLAFIYNNDNIYYRRRVNNGFSNWRRLAFANEIPTSLKNPHALTISLNGTSQGPYDGSAAKNINITPGSIGAAVSNHSHDYLVVNTADDKSFNSAYHNFQVLYAGGSNGITGKPANVDAFGLFRFRAAIGWSGQMLLANGGSLYIRSSEDAKMTNTLAWKTILDSSNYSGILDSRYYTESEVNSLLSKKLDRVNLSVGSWNPRGYNLAADYFYNGGDLSISESKGQIHVSVDGYFWQNVGRYRVLDTSDVAGLKGDLTVRQYLSNTNTTWWPLIWGGSAHNNTNNSTGAVYKSHDVLSWQTSSQTLYATNIRTENIKHLSIGGGIFWNPNVESATDSTDAASITLVKSGVAGGTTLVLSQMNDNNDTIQFKTSTAARLYHNSYPILTTQNTYVNNHKGYINGTEITQVNNANTLDRAHLIRYGNGTGIKQVYYFHTQGNNTSYIKLGTLNTVAVTGAGSSKVMFTVKGGINFGGTNESVYEVAASTRGSIQVTSTLVRGNRELKFGYVSTSSNVEIWMAYDGTFRGVTEVEVSSSVRFTLAMTETTTKPSGFVEGSYRILASTADNVASATNAYHLRINSANTWSTWYWAGQSGQPNWLWGSNDGTNMYVWNPSNFNVHTAQYLRSLGNQNCQTGRTQNYGDVYSYNTYKNTGSPTAYTSVIGFGRGIAGTVEIAGGWNNTNLYWRSLRDCCEDWYSWRTVLDSNNYTDFIGSYYWANVKISASSSTTTSPTVHTLTATRICAGHDPGIDNSISCSNWFRSSGNTGWYNTTYRGGWYMSDTSWIRTHNNVGIHAGQIYADSSIRMSSIRLERTNEINSSDNLLINYGSSTNVSLCQGGGNVGIGTLTPTQKLDVRGNIITKGFGIRPYYLSKSVLLPTISPGDGYKYKCLEIDGTTEISCIIADRAGLMNERGILIKFNKGYDGQIILLKDLQNYGSGNGYFWVMPSGCKIIKADSSSILIGQNQISNTYDDGHSRFLVYSSVYSVWIEFLCSNIN